MSRQSNNVIVDFAKEARDAVILSLYIIGSLYGPALNKLIRQYTELKQNKKIKEVENLDFDEDSYKKAHKEIIRQAEEIVAPAKEIVAEAMKTYNITQKPKYNIIHNTIAEVLEEKFKSFFQELEKMELVVYQSQQEYTLNAIAIGTEIITRQKREKQIKELSKRIQTENINPIWNNPVFYKAGLISAFLTIALNIYLDTGGLEATKSTATAIFESSIIEDIEEFFEDNLIIPKNTFFEMNNTISKEQTEEVPIEALYVAEFNKILTQEGISFETKLDKIIHSGITNYKNTFDFFLENPEIYTKLSINQTMSKIIHSNITSYTNIFDYIIETETINMDTKMNLILNSGIADDKSIFHYVLTKCGLKQYEAMEYIARSSYTYEEKFNFFTKNEGLSIEQKVVYSLLIPDVSFATLLNDLFKLEGTTEDQIIKIVVDADIVPFETLFNALLKQETISQEKFLKYLVIYNACFNTVTNKEKANYLLNLNNFDESTKLDTIWNLLDDYSIEQKFDFIFDLFDTNFEEYLKVYDRHTKALTENQQRMMYLVNKMLGEMEEYILSHFDYNSKEELYEDIAVTAGEGCHSFKDLYWVANTIFNRITNPAYVKAHGTNPHNQVIAKKQFTIWENGSYKVYLNANKSDNIKKFDLAKLAFYIMFYKNYEGIEHSYLEFRWNGSTLYDVKIDPKGNCYGRAMKEDTRIDYEQLRNQPLPKEKNRILLLARVLEQLNIS